MSIGNKDNNYTLITVDDKVTKSCYPQMFGEALHQTTSFHIKADREQ